MAPFIGQPVQLLDGNGNALVAGAGPLAVNVSQVSGFAANVLAVPGPSGSTLNAPLYATAMMVAPSGTTLDTLRTPSIFKQATATASGSTALWTPAAGKKFRLMRYMVTVPSNAGAAAQALLSIALLDAAGAIGQLHTVNIPSTAVLTAAPPLYVSPWLDLGNGVLSALANNVLNINLSFALTGGSVNVIACGTEE